MIGNWYRHESDVPAPAMLALMTLLLGLTTLGVAITIALGRSRGVQSSSTDYLIYMVFASMIWSVLAVYLLTPAFRLRCSRFAMTLPVASRRIWARNLFSALSTGSFIVLIMCGTLLVTYGRLVRDRADTACCEPGMVTLTTALLSCMILSIVLLQCYQPDLNKLTVKRGDILTILAIALGGFLLVLALGKLPWLMSLAPLLLAVMLGLRTYRALPNVFSLHPRKPSKRHHEIAAGSSPGAAYAPRNASGLRQSLLLWNTIQRSMAKYAGLRWVPYPILFAFGMMLSGVYSAAIGSEEVRFTYIFLVAYCMLAFGSAQLSYLRTLDSLPIPRKVIFAVLMLPTLVSVMAGYGAGRLWTVKAQQDSGLIGMLGENQPRPAMIRPDSYVFAVHREYLEIAWDGEPADIVAPWGESHPVWKLHPVKGGTAVMFSPYSSPRGSSMEFVAWQLSRAVSAIYGSSIAPEEIRERYLMVVDDELIVARGDGLTIARDYDLRARVTGTIFPIIILPTCLAWLFAMYLFLLSNRASVTASRRKLAYFSIMGGLLVLHIIHLPLLMLGILEPSALDGVISILSTQLHDALPLAGLLMWAVSGVIFYGCYLRVQAAFGRMEVSRSGPDLWFPLLDGKLKDR